MRPDEAASPMDPEQIQEYLFFALGGAFPFALITNLTYNLKIRGFFTELEAKDQEARKQLGSPSKNENFRPISGSNVRMLGFVPVLRAKAALADFPKSRAAWRWFKLAAVATSTMFTLAGILVVWSVLNELS